MCIILPGCYLSCIAYISIFLIMWPQCLFHYIAKMQQNTCKLTPYHTKPLSYSTVDAEAHLCLHFKHAILLAVS